MRLGDGGQESDSSSTVFMSGNLWTAKRGQWKRKWRTISSASPQRHIGESIFFILKRNRLSLQWPERSCAKCADGGNTSRALALITEGRKRCVVLLSASRAQFASHRFVMTSQTALFTWAFVGCWMDCRADFTKARNTSKAAMVETGIRGLMFGTNDLFNTISAILRSTGKTFDSTAAADLKHLEILRRKGRLTDFSRAEQLLLRDA